MKSALSVKDRGTVLSATYRDRLHAYAPPVNSGTGADLNDTSIPASELPGSPGDPVTDCEFISLLLVFGNV